MDCTPFIAVGLVLGLAVGLGFGIAIGQVNRRQLMSTMRIFAVGLFVGCLFVGLAGAQWKVPDGLPPLPFGGYTCNDANTHCLVNYEFLIEHAKAEERAKEITTALMYEIHKLSKQVADLQWARIQRCTAVVDVVPMGRKVAPATGAGKPERL